MKIYYAPRTISIASVIALHEVGADFALRLVDFTTGEQTKPAYHRLNPKGRVPVLDLGDGTLLTETGAILEYLAGTHPEAGLMPDDPPAAAHVRSVMYYLASTMHPNHAHMRRGHRWADKAESHADMSAKVPETMTTSAQYIEDHGLRGDFVLGERISVADFYLYVVCSWLEMDGVDVSAFPGIRAFRAAMQARASVRAVHDAEML